MDKLEQTVAHERMKESQRLEAPEDADLNHPALKPIHDKMVSSHQRRMQQLAAKEKELDRQMQQLTAMTQMSQQQYQSTGSHQEPSVADGDFDWLEPEVRPMLSDPQGGAQLRALMRSIEKRTAATAPTENLSRLDQTVQQLQTQLQQTQAQLTQERYARQIPEFRQKYGSVLDEDISQNVLKHALASGMDLERALYATHPEVAMAQERARIEKEVSERFRNEYGASLEGMEDVVSSQPQPNAKPVDSNGKLVDFRQTAMEVLGKGGMVSAIRDGFSREETITQG